jgi:DNA-binding CsgD family transcriptional regulator
LELSRQKTALERKNAALQEVLAQIEIEKKHIKDDVMLNIDRLLMPVLKRLKRKGTRLDRTYVGLLEKNLNELTCSLGRKLSERERKLTPREIEICNMIRNGLSSKEIAGLLHISYRTIELHRATIRKKFGITHKSVNLASYLQSL